MDSFTFHLRTKRLNPFLLISLLSLLGSAFYLMHRPQVPMFQGKSMQVWLWDYYRNGDKVAVTNAVRSIGTNAIPTLVKMLARTDSVFFCSLDSWWTRHIHGDRLPEWLIYPSWHKNSAVVVNEEALLGFQILATDAQSAVPVLIHLCENQAPPVKIGFPVGALVAVDPTRKAAIPFFLRYTGDPDEYIQWFATSELTKLRCEPRFIILPLISALGHKDPSHRSTAARQLGSIGAEAKEAVPALLSLLYETNSEVRAAAADSVKRIDPKDAALAGIN